MGIAFSRFLWLLSYNGKLGVYKYEKTFAHLVKRPAVLITGNLIVSMFFYRASEIAHFQQVLKHPAFKANPLGAIAEHIKNAVQKDLENAT